MSIRDLMFILVSDKSQALLDPAFFCLDEDADDDDDENKEDEELLLDCCCFKTSTLFRRFRLDDESAVGLEANKACDRVVSSMLFSAPLLAFDNIS